MIMAHTADTLRTDQGAWTGPPTQWQSADRLHGKSGRRMVRGTGKVIDGPLSGTHIIESCVNNGKILSGPREI
jgi:hypothetical protein